MTPAQQATLDLLGAVPSERPTFDPRLGEQLSLELQRGLAPLIETMGPQTLWLSKRGLDLVHGCQARYLADDAAEFEWSVPAARGTVAHKAIELTLGLGHDTPPLTLVEEAMASLQARDNGLSDWLHRCADHERADLMASANATVAAFAETFPPLDRRWRPVLEGSLRHELFDGAIVLSGKPDLTLGQPRDGVSGKVIIDFKTGGSAGAHLADLRFYALLETLRSGVPPRLVATHYLSQGKLQPEEVTIDSLEAALDRTIAAAHKMVSLRTRPELATTTPSWACRWCPVSEGCAPGTAWLAGVDDDRFDLDE